MIELALKLALLLNSLVPQEAELLFVGDAMAHGPQLRAASTACATKSAAPTMRWLISRHR